MSIPIAVFENKIKILIHGPNIQVEDADCEFSVDLIPDAFHQVLLSVGLIGSSTSWN